MQRTHGPGRGDSSFRIMLGFKASMTSAVTRLDAVPSGAVLVGEIRRFTWCPDRPLAHVDVWSKATFFLVTSHLKPRAQPELRKGLSLKGSIPKHAEGSVRCLTL